MTQTRTHTTRARQRLVLATAALRDAGIQVLQDRHWPYHIIASTGGVRVSVRTSGYLRDNWFEIQRLAHQPNFGLVTDHDYEALVGPLADVPDLVRQTASTEKP